MKFHWGHGIFIFLGIFLLTMAFIVYKSFQEKNTLVEAEYYPKGLVYQQQIDRKANADAMAEKISLNEEGGNVIVRYPADFKKGNVSGSLYFYRPSDDAGDHTEPMKPDTAMQQIIPASKFMTGKYVVKMNWKMDGKEFYHEEVIIIRH